MTKTCLGRLGQVFLCLGISDLQTKCNFHAVFLLRNATARGRNDHRQAMKPPQTTKKKMKSKKQPQKIKVRFENQRSLIERLLAMPNDYPSCERDVYLRDVRGTGAYLRCVSGVYEISVSA